MKFKEFAKKYRQELIAVCIPAIIVTVIIVFALFDGQSFDEFYENTMRTNEGGTVTESAAPSSDSNTTSSSNEEYDHAILIGAESSKNSYNSTIDKKKHSSPLFGAVSPKSSRNDTFAEPPESEVQPAASLHDKPTLAYKYPRKIRQKESGKYIYVHVNIQKPTNVARELKEEILTFKQTHCKIEDTSDVITIQINPYKYLTVSIENPVRSLIIDTPADQQARQQIDTVHGNSWKWRVRTDTGYGNVNLVLHVKGEDSLIGIRKITDREIPIEISVESNFFPALWTWLVNHPESFLTLLFIPLVKWLAELFKKKKKEDKNPRSSE